MPVVRFLVLCKINANFTLALSRRNESASHLLFMLITQMSLFVALLKLKRNVPHRRDITKSFVRLNCLKFQFLISICYNSEQGCCISGSSSVLINTPVSDGGWHHVAWTRRYKRITLTLDGAYTAQADLPGVDAEFNIAQEPVVSVDIGGLPTGVSQAKGKLGYDLYRFWFQLCTV